MSTKDRQMLLSISILFILGYVAIVMEHPLRINKAATALITGVLCWTVYSFFAETRESVTEELTGYLGEVAGILFFLLGAMVVVELIDAHDMSYLWVTGGLHQITSPACQSARRARGACRPFQL